jgi:hypothetical protein
MRFAATRAGFTRRDAVKPSVAAAGAASLPRTPLRMNPARITAPRWLRACDVLCGDPRRVGCARDAIGLRVSWFA